MMNGWIIGTLPPFQEEAALVAGLILALVAEIADRWRAAMWGKQAGHGIDAADFVRPVRSMGGIGG